MFKDFGKRIQRDTRRIVDARIKRSEELSGGRMKVCCSTRLRNQSLKSATLGHTD